MLALMYLDFVQAIMLYKMNAVLVTLVNMSLTLSCKRVEAGSRKSQKQHSSRTVHAGGGHRHAALTKVLDL